MLAQATLDQILNSLAAAGPLALVLGVAVYALWRANGAERVLHSAQEDAMRAREDAMRREFLAASDHERERHAVEEEKIRAEYVGTLKKLTQTLKENS